MLLINYLGKPILLNGFESHKPLFNNILKCCTHTQNNIFYRDSYFDLNRTKYSIYREFDVDLDLTAVFNLKKSPTCSPYLNPTEHIFLNMNITDFLKHFQYDEFKTRLKFKKSDWFKFI